MLLNGPGLRWLVVMLLLQHPSPSQQAASKSAMHDVNFSRSDSRCWRYVSVLSNVTPRHLGSEQKSRVSLLWLTFSSCLAFLLLRWKTANTASAVLSCNFYVWRHSPTAVILCLAPISLFVSLHQHT